MSRQPTEQALKFWRYGQTQAERLCAGLLALEGFRSIDPQCPLGGPDGLKDVLCEKQGWKYVAAATFPPTEQAYKDIKKKFQHDLAGVKANGADALAFFVNQTISPSERDQLHEMAVETGAHAVVYHVERMRALLDAPRGYGLRLEYLRIAMTEEEQIDFWSEWKDDITVVLARQDTSFRHLAGKIDEFIASTQSFFMPLPADKGVEMSLANNSGNVDPGFSASLTLTVQKIKMVHQFTDVDIPLLGLGLFREVPVWIGAPGSTIEDAAYQPPPPEEVAVRIEKLLNEWNSRLLSLASASDREKVEAITDFHHGFLFIHPFVDGNGRVARSLLRLQVRHMLDNVWQVAWPDQRAYFKALQKAHRGNREYLLDLIWGSLLFIPHV